MKATCKNIKTSVQKLNLVAELVRNLKVDKARSVLTFCRKNNAKPMYKVLMSAIANAQNNFSIDVDNLHIKRVLVGKGMLLKRFSPRARGRASRIHKHYTNLTIHLEEINGSKS